MQIIYNPIAIDRGAWLQQYDPKCCKLQQFLVLFDKVPPMSQTSKLSRISVGLSDREYEDLQTLAEKHRVSMAWLGRQAIIEFLDRHGGTDRQLPLELPSTKRTANG